jgi:DNA polymerase-3 subunit alpha
LIKAGAFDVLGARRSQLLAVLSRAVQGGQARQEDRKRGQRSLFDSFGSAEPDDAGEAEAMVLPDVPEMPDAERLAEEKKALGFYMSSHPLARHESALNAFSSHSVSALGELPERQEVTVGGMIQGVTVRNVSKSRSGLTRMVKFTFEDLSGTVAAMLWPEEFAKFEDKVADDAIVFLKGSMNRTREPAELVVNRVIPIDEAPALLSRGVVVTLRKGVHESEQVERLHRLVRVRPGNLDLYLEIMGLEQVRRAIYKASPNLKVRLDEKLLPEFESAVGAGNVRLLGQRGASARPEPVAARAPSWRSFAGEEESDGPEERDDD